MGWREAWRLSSVAFRELSLQAIYAIRLGNPPPSGRLDKVVRTAQRRVVQSKVIIASVLALIAAGGVDVVRLAPTIVSSPFFGVPVPVAVFQAGVLTGLLSLDVAFLWWTGLQVLPTFIASGVLPVLEPLPISDRTLRRVAGILYLRMFDLPALTVLIVTPLFVGWVLGAPSGLAIIPGVVAAVAFALALALLTGRFFVRRVQGSRGGGGRAILRWAYLVLWVLPAFAMFGFVIAAPGFLALLARTAGAGPSLTGDLLVSAFPFTFALLPSVVTQGGGVFGLDATGVGILALASASVAVSNDSGLLHVAAALGTPSIGIFGPTSPWHWAPLNPLAATVQAASELPCRPCHKPVCRLVHHRCMRDLTPEEVLAATHQALAAVSVGLHRND